LLDQTLAIQSKYPSEQRKQNNSVSDQLISEVKLAYPNATYITVTNYYFNDNAHNLAKEQNIKLIEYNELKDIISKSIVTDNL
jgi:HJR/Mrr/RecB family endonuclease